MSKAGRYLIVNPFGIGDVLFTTPVVRSIREDNPKAYIAYLCNQRSKEVLVNNPNIDDIFIFEKDDLKNQWKKSKIKCFFKIKGDIRRISKSKFDILIDFSLTHQFALIAALIGIKQRIGYNYKSRGRFLTDKIDIDGFSGKHMIEFYTDILKLLNIKCFDKNLELSVDASDLKWSEGYLKERLLKKSDLTIGIIPGGGASWGGKSYYKQWSIENYAELCNQITQKLNANIISLGGTDDVILGDKLKTLTGDNVLDLCGQLNLRQFSAMLHKCDVVVANDGGPLHIAISQKIKTLSFFGPVDPDVYGPYPLSKIHKVLTHAVHCRPCYQNFRVPECLENHECLRAIDSKQVFEELQKLLSLKHKKPAPLLMQPDKKPVAKRMADVTSIKEAQDVQKRIYNRSFKDGPFQGAVAELCLETRIKFALKNLIGNDNRILDLGCGDGGIDRGIIAKAREIIGVDVSNKAIKLAEDINNNDRIKYMNITIEDFESVDKFDAIIMYEIIEHVYDARAILEKVHRLLNQNGHLILSTPNYLKLIRRLKLLPGIKQIREMMGKETDRINFDHYHEFYYKELKVLLEDVGFEIFDRTGVVIWTNTVGGDLFRNIGFMQRLNFDSGKLFLDIAGDMYIAASKKEV